MALRDYCVAVTEAGELDQAKTADLRAGARPSAWSKRGVDSARQGTPGALRYLRLYANGREMDRTFSAIFLAIAILVIGVSVAPAEDGGIRWLSERRASLLDIGRLEANIALLRMQKEGLPEWHNVDLAITRTEFDAAKQQFIVRATLITDQAEINKETCLTNLTRFREAAISFISLCPEPCVNPGTSPVTRLFHLERFGPEIRPRSLDVQLEAATRFQVILSTAPEQPKYLCESDPDGNQLRSVRAKR